MNDQLEAFQLESAALTEVARQREQFENAWNQLHLVRTLAAILALILAIVACLSPEKA